MLIEIFDANQTLRLGLMVEFAFLSLVGLTGMMKMVYLDSEIRKLYDNRLDVFNTFFQVYKEEEERIVREKQEKRDKQEKLKNMVISDDMLNIPTEDSHEEDDDFL